MSLKNLLSVFVLLLSLSAHSQSEKPAYAEVISTEFDFKGGSLEGKLKIIAYDTIVIEGKTMNQWPGKWAGYCELPGVTQLLPGDSMFLDYKIQVPDDLPFFPEEFKIGIPFTMVVNASKAEQYVYAIGKLYFTPYGSVEIMSAHDFENTYRVWLDRSSNIPALRVYIPRDQIPVSDLNLETDTVGGKDQDDIEVRYVKVPGLAYDIPMKVDRNAIPPGEGDDGLDSLDESDGIAYLDEKNGPSAKVFGRTFHGVVTGRITSDILNDLQMPRNIPLSGIYVKLKERDKWFDEDFGIAHCDANGNFRFEYHEWQSSLEGKHIELYVVIQSKNKNYDIKAKRHAILGSSYEQERDLGSFGTNAGVINGSINTNIRAMRVTSWAVRSWEYCQGTGGHGLYNDLSILPGANGSNFVADGFLGISAPFTKPTIRITSEDCDQEGTLYHEFGHFVMWNIQNRNYIAVYSDPSQSGHSWDRENTPETAWSEGWAAAHEMIMDAAHWWEDQEYGFNENRRPYEARETWPRINNGIWAEYYVATAIYDLWDGTDPGIPDFVPWPFGLLYVGHRDDGISPWATIDDVHYNFMWILLPISQNGGSSGKLKNIEEYFYFFRDHIIGTFGCQEKANLARVFRENRVMQNITNFRTNEPSNATSLSGDNLYIPIRLTYPTRFLGIPITRSVTHKINPPTDYFQTGSRTMDLNFGAEVPPYINENLFVTGASGVANSRIRINPTYTYPFYSSGTITTCDNPRLLFDYSNLELGGTQTTARVEISGQSLFQFNTGARLVLNPNSTFVVRAGATLHVRAGAFVDGGANAQIIVENGGYICIEQGATLTLQGGSGFVLQPGAIIGVNPALGIATGVCTNPPPPAVVNEALQFDGANDIVNIPNTSGTLDHGTGNFTWEAYIRLTPSPTGTHQSILSKRTTVNGGVADGYIFGIWSNGQLFVQLAGTPNTQSAVQTINLLDGNCHHVAVSRNGINLSFYVDGQFIGNGQNTSNRNINSPGPVIMGIDPISTLPVNGWIGEIRIWNVARTNAQIAASVNANLITPQAGLVSYYDMRDPVNSQVLGDISGNATPNNGRLGNAVGVDNQDPVWLTAAQVTCSVGGNFRTVTRDYDPASDPDSVAMKQVTAADKAITEAIASGKAMVYPNPSAQAFRLYLPATYRNVQIEIVNAAGVVVEQRNIRQSESNIRFGENLRPGVYMLRIRNGKSVETFKLVKQ